MLRIELGQKVIMETLVGVVFPGVVQLGYGSERLQHPINRSIPGGRDLGIGRGVLRALVCMCRFSALHAGSSPQH